MRVIFTHVNEFNWLDEPNGIPRLLLYLAAYAWKKQRPGDTVVLYGDAETVNYVNSRQFCPWDEVTLLDFRKVQQERQISPEFWAWPRVYSALFETGPCCIVDTDVLLLRNLHFSPDKPWAAVFANNTARELKVLRGVPQLVGQYVNDYYCGGGFIYHPNAKYLHELSQRILSLDHDPLFLESVRKFGYGDSTIVVEQSLPYTYYAVEKGLEIERLHQIGFLQEVVDGIKGDFYHAMGEKYEVSQKNQKEQYVHSLGKILSINYKSFSQILLSLDFSVQFVESFKKYETSCRLL